jgi:hypothetical protein
MGSARDEGPETVPSTTFWTKTRKWVTGILVASLTAALTALILSILQSTPDAVRDVLSGHSRTVTINTSNGPTLSVSIEQGFQCNASGWVFPVSPTDPLVNSPPGEGQKIDGQTWNQNPAAFGAQPAGPVRLTVAASTAQTRAITLRDIEIELVERHEPLMGTRIESSGGCGNGVTYHARAVDFDKPFPYWAPFRVARGDAHLRVDALEFPYKVTPNSPSLLLIEVLPGDCYCEWRATLEWFDGEEHGETTIGDRDQPFHTTSSAGIPAYSWLEGKRVPVE